MGPDPVRDRHLECRPLCYVPYGDWLAKSTDKIKIISDDNET